MNGAESEGLEPAYRKAGPQSLMAQQFSLALPERLREGKEDCVSASGGPDALL